MLTCRHSKERHYQPELAEWVSCLGKPIRVAIMTKRALGNICRVLIAHILSLDEIASLLKVAQGRSEKLLHADICTEFLLLPSIAKDHFVVKNGFRRLYGTWLPRPNEVLYGIGYEGDDMALCLFVELLP